MIEVIFAVRRIYAEIEIKELMYADKDEYKIDIDQEVNMKEMIDEYDEGEEVWIAFTEEVKELRGSSSPMKTQEKRLYETEIPYKKNARRSGE